jgi:amino acid transporter
MRLLQILTSIDWNSAVLILRYWVSDETMPSWAWCLIFWVVFNILTTMGVSVYGELEYFFGMFKFISLAVLFFLAILANVGAFGGGYVGFKYWGAPTGNYFSIRFLTIAHTIRAHREWYKWLWSSFCARSSILCRNRNRVSRCGRVQESPKGRSTSRSCHIVQPPQTNTYQGTNSIVYRILFVFIGMTFFQGLICPSDDPNLLNATSKVASSPFTIGFERAGWSWAGHFVNSIILVAFISAGNGVVYVQSRTLHSMAKTGRAPKIFAKVSKRGVPWPAILVSNLWGFLSLMNRKLAAGQVFSYITSVGGTAAYIAWIAIIFVHLRVRAAAAKQGIDVATFPYKAVGSIWIYRFNFCFNIFLLLIQGFVVFETPFDWRGFIASYITLPTFAIFYVGFKFWNKTKWVKLEDIDFSDRKEWVAQKEDTEEKRTLTRRIITILKD